MDLIGVVGIHHFIISNDLDSDFFVVTSNIAGSNNITKDAFSAEPKHCVALVHYFTSPDSYNINQYGQ